MADQSIDELYLKKVGLDQIGGDASAIGAASFDRVEIINDPVRGPLKFGYDADLGQNYEISPAVDAPITDAPQEPNVKTVVEDGVSFDVEVRSDGSEILLGKTDAPEERRGVGILLRGPSEQEPPGLPIDEDDTEDDGIGEIFTDIGQGLASGTVKAADEIVKAFRLDGLVDYLREQLSIEPTVVDPPKGLAGQLAEPLAQGLTVMAPAALSLGALGVTSAFLRWTLAGAAGDALAFAPDDPAMGELAADIGKLDSKALEALRVGIVQALKKNEGDGEFKKRIKNVSGGLLAGLTIDGLVVLFRAGKGFKNASKAVKAKLRELITEAETALGLGAAVAIPVAAEAQDGKDGETIELAGLIDRFLSRAVRAAKELPEPTPTGPAKAPSPDLPGIDIPGAPKVPPIGRISTTEEAMAAFENVAKEKAAEIKKATRGKVSLKETEEAGRRIERETLDLMGEEGDSVTDFMAGLATSVKNLNARVQAARELLVSSMELATERATAIVKPLEEITDKELFDYLEQEARHNQLQILFTGARAEIGRALGAFRNVAESAGDVSLAAKERTSQVIAETIQQSGGKKAIVARAVALLSTPPEKRGGLIKKLQRSTALDVIQEIYINNLLFGLRTQEVNFASTQLFMLWQPLERIVAAAIGKTRKAFGTTEVVPLASTEETVQMNEAAALLVGYIEGIKDSAKVAWQVFKTETPNDPLTKIETSRFRAITSERLGLDPGSILGKAVDVYGIYQRVPGRGLMAVDEFNKGIARNMERRAQAVRLSNAALEEGVEPQDAARLYADVLAGNNQTAEEAARSFADTVTFTRELGEIGRAGQTFARKAPGMFVILPFIRTPTNLIKEFAYRGPQAILSPKVYRDWKAGGIERDLAVAKIGLGTGLMMWASSLAMSGIINGYGPTNFKQRKVWLEKNQPYSINLRKLLGDERFKKMGLEREWLPFGGLEPLDTLFGVSANYAQWKMWGPLNKINEEDEALASVAALGAVLQNLGDRTYLRGISQAAEAFDEPGRFLERYLANVITRAVPFVGTTMAGDIESAISPPRSDVRRDPNEKNPAINHFYAVMNKIMARTPGLSSRLPPNVTDDGRDIVAFEGSWVNAFNRFAPKADKATPYHEELIRLHYPLSMPRRAAFGVKLRPWQYHAMMKAFNEVEFEYIPGDGKPVNKLAALNRLVKSAQYNAQFTIEGKLALMQRLRSKYLDAAKNAMTDVTNEKYYDSDLFAAKIERSANPGTVDFLEPPP